MQSARAGELRRRVRAAGISRRPRLLPHAGRMCGPCDVSICAAVVAAAGVLVLADGFGDAGYGRAWGGEPAARRGNGAEAGSLRGKLEKGENGIGDGLSSYGLEDSDGIVMSNWISGRMRIGLGNEMMGDTGTTTRMAVRHRRGRHHAVDYLVLGE
ncbi:hypothetical protein B0H11DRAFT_1935827 [Mycena galericulata]|nr:hypothetical protein B0H11DRAFT_1935827 [Mycena galericulata]